MYNKKIIALVAAAALAACFALVGCGSTQEAPATDTSSTEATATADTQSTSASNESTDASASSSTESQPAATDSQPAATDNYIGEDAAKAAALADAGLAEGDVTELEAELDLDDAVVHYDVDFKSGGMEYNYDIDAVTGDILNGESEVDD